MPLGSLPRAAVVALVLGVTAVGLGACESGLSSSAPAPTPSGLASNGPGPTANPSSVQSTPPVSESPTRPSLSAQNLSSAEQAQLDQQLRDAAWKNDVKAARQLIDRGADVNAKDSTVQSAYLIATSEGHLELLRLTLAKGADVNDKDSWNGTGLIRAAERGHHLVVGELVQAGIEKNHVNRIGYQALHEAVWLGRNSAAYVDTVRVLVAGGVQLTQPSATEQLTPLQMARSRGYDRLEAVLVKATEAKDLADPDAELLGAAQAGDADRVALALRAGADIEARDGDKRTALLLAATDDRIEVARLLVAMGASPDALDDRHDTPWLVTGVTGSVAMLETLLPANPDLTIRNRFGGVSVIPASERGHVDYVRRVVRTGIDVNHVNDLGWTALLEAVVLGDGGRRHQAIVRILLDAGADPTISDKGGVTPLEHTRAKGFDAIARILQ
jgi:ankyrin repeat protein